MLNAVSTRFDRTNAIIGLGVVLVVFVIYNLTKAPTFSFWDCGEFVASAITLGIPHPPGTPLFIIIGRLFWILPLADDPAVRVNLLSVVSNAFTALFVYLTVVRLLNLWFGEDRSGYSRFLVYAGGACGACMAAFGITQWNNSVEAEVYGLMMVMLSAALWLTVIYYEHRGTPFGVRVMLLIAFIAGFGIGVHLTVFLILPIAALLFVLKKETPSGVWFALTAFVFLELYLIFAMSSRPNEVPLYVPALIGFIIYLFFVFSFEKISREHLYLGIGLFLSALPALGLLLSTGSNLVNILNGIAWLGIVGASGYAVWLLSGLSRLKKSGGAKAKEVLTGQNIAAPVIVLVTLFMLLVLTIDFSGYKNFLYLSALLVLGLGWFIRKYLKWTTLISVLAACLVIIGIWEFFYALIAAVVLNIILGLGFKFEHWKTAILILLLVATGFSVHFYLPIRSTQSPMIDQNKVSRGLAVTINFLERKQYGRESMVSRMFTRRAEWTSQFGVYQRMGFWKFFSEQWGLTNNRFLFLFLLGIYGMWELIRRRPKPGLTVLILLLTCSLGLVLYMNFADGLRDGQVPGPAHLEVRDRDYFFTPFFVFFGLAIGVGVSLLMQYVRELSATMAKPPRMAVLTILPLMLLLPALAVAKNYYRCDRSGNYMPYEYAKNILMSCDKNAVLFTGGDNDTFPLWAIQGAYNYRTDVAVVCLPLANTDWYFQQMKDYYKLELGMSDDQISELRPYRLPDGKVYRIQDQLINAIITYNAHERPIEFCLTTGASSQLYNGESLDSLLTQEGLVLRYNPSAPHNSVDMERCVELFGDEFGYRSYADPNVYKDDASRRSARNMAQAAMLIADSLRRGGELERAEPLARKIATSLPAYHEAWYFLAAALNDLGRIDEVKEMVDSSTGSIADELGIIYARGLRTAERDQEAERYLQMILQRSPKFRPAMEELTRLYVKANAVGGLEHLFAEWLKYNPDDARVADYLKQLRSIPAPDSNNQN